MLRRLMSVGVAVAVLVAVGGAIAGSCYDLPQPDCGFLCGPNAACPDGYTCAADQVCHRVGAPASLVCPSPDAAIFVELDAAPDAGDAGPAGDATGDAVTDGATIDGALDAGVDAADVDALPAVR